jgi:Rrf2 family transcriptional regulator, iron-sulfur cluster assembly transcription factor
MRLELTRSTDYAVRGMFVLARSPGQTISSVEIAERTHIPVRFVTQIMAHLVRAGLVGAVIGRSGGYRLNAAPEEITVLSIVEAVEGDTRRRHCVLRGGPCQRTTPCEIHHVFSAAQEAFIAQLAGTSLAAVTGTDTRTE